MTGRAWSLDHHSGGAGEFHALDLPVPTNRVVWWFEVQRPAIVLGSTQNLAVVDRVAADRAGVEVVRRRSGGGAVWLAPGVVTWLDLVLPAGDPLWDDDVSRAAAWVGETWVRTLDRLGHPGGNIHQGGLVATAWSPLVCFAGLGPGEVSIDGHKVLGVSQRRTRSGARFQCALLHYWDPGPLLEVLDLAPAEREAASSALVLAARGV
ncbi:MAG: hypothetical protein ABIP03_08580, partial [Aquihabitans sp.]